MNEFCDICGQENFRGGHNCVKQSGSKSAPAHGSIPSLADNLPLTCEDCIQCSTHNDERDSWCALKGAIVYDTCKYFESVDGRVRE